MLSLEDGDTSITAHILEETYYDQNGIWISHHVTKKGHEKIVYLTYEWHNQVWLQYLSGYMCQNESEDGNVIPSNAFVFMDWNQKAEELHLVQPGDCTLVLGEFGTLSDTTVRGFKLKYWNYRNYASFRGFLAGCSSGGTTWGDQVQSSGRLCEKIGFSQLGLKPYPAPIDFYNEGLLRCFSHPTLGQLQFSAEGAIVMRAASKATTRPKVY